MKPRFFASPEAFRKWLAANHQKASELIVGFYKRTTGKPSLTWPESVDEALCFGWIDGIRRRLDEARYTIRFTPRRAGSYWSEVNTKRANELIKAGRMQPAGLDVFKRRDITRTKQYLYEREHATLSPEHERQFKANRPAWEFFEAQPPGYRRLCIQFVVAAKQEPTRVRRLEAIIDHSAKGLRFRWM